MAELQFSDENKFSLDAPVARDIVDPSQLDKELASYASALTSQKPLEQYHQIIGEISDTGTSANLASILSVLKQEENKQIQKTVTSIISDPSLPKEEKFAALKYYEQKRDVIPALKEQYSLKIAAANEEAPIDAESLTRGFFEKEQAINEIQSERNKDASNWSDSTLNAFGGFMLEILPFVGAGYKGAQYSAMLKAVDSKDYGAISIVANSILQGSAVENIQKAIAAIPTSYGKVQAVRRLLDVVKEFPGTDFNRYTAVVATLEGDQANWEKNLMNVLGLVGTFGAVAATGKLFKDTIKVTPTVNTDSLLGRTSAHNPQVASEIAGKAIVDETGEVAAAIGAKNEQIVSDLLPKVDDEVSHALNVEASAALRQELAPLDEAGRSALEATEKAYILYPRELADNLSRTILDTVASVKSAAVHLGKSTFNVGETSISGKAVFGKTGTAPFQSYDEALTAAKELAGELPEGAITIVKPGRGGTLRPAYATTKTKGDYYLQFNYAKEVTAQDVAIFGPDAVKVKFDLFGKEIKPISDLLTRVALSGGKVGSYLFAHHFVPPKAANAAFASFDKALQVEEPFLTYARDFVAKQNSKNRSMISELLSEGENYVEGGKLGTVFKYDEVIKKSLAKGLSQSEAEEIAKGYYVYRRIADWMYTLADRAKSKDLRNKGYTWIDNEKGVRFAGQPVSKNEVADIRSVVNKETGGVEVITKQDIDKLYDEGNTLIRMAYPLKEGDKTYQYAKMSRGFKSSEISGGALPYIHGYVPRGYENAYFVVRTPTKIELNGISVTDKKTLENNRTTHYASDSMEDAKKRANALNAKDPTGKYEVKRDRLSEKSLLDEADVFRQNMIHSSRRGKEVVEGGNKIDPMVGLISLVQSMSKKAAMEDFLEATKKDFVRQFNDFLVEPGIFPSGKDQIIAKSNMTIDESRKFRQAQALYNWLEGMMVMQRYDSAIWKDTMYGIGEFAEKFAPIFGTMLRSIGKNYPVDYLRKISTALFISLRPARQILLQPSQLMLYSSIDPKLLNPMETMRFFGKIGALGFSKFYKNSSSIGTMIPDELIIKAGSKLFNQTDVEFKATLEAFKNSGLLQSVDSNTLVDGLYSQKNKKLIETTADKFARRGEALLEAIPKLGRQIGFDRGEEVNLAGSWIIARDRFIKMNPDVDINSRFAGETIAANARELAFSMSRPGSFQYQKNALSLPLQFIAAPHKALLALTTSKMLTAQEKARLMASHFILYGSAGLGIQQFVLGDGAGGVPGLNLRAKYGSSVPDDVFLTLEGGLADWGVNTLINTLIDKEGEQSRLDVASSFSPLSGGIIPISDFLSSLNEDPAATVILGPSWNIVDPNKGRIVTAIRDISGMMRGDEDTSTNFKDIMYRAAELSSGGTDWMKYRLARNADLLVAANGYKIDDKITAAEAVGKLFGVATIREKVIYEQLKQSRDETKEAQDAVKYIFDGFVKRSRSYGDDPTSVQQLNREISAWMSMEKDERLKRVMQEEFRKLTKKYAKTTGRSLEENLYYGASSKSQEQIQDTFNIMKSYGMDNEAAVIKNLTGTEE